MTKLFQSVLIAIASSTHRELARQIRYLKVENEILRSKLPVRITVTIAEQQRLVRFARKLGRALHQLVSIVTPGTVLRWLREERRGNRLPLRRGRRRQPVEIRRLIVKLARENDWGYTRILGELKKLGIRSISKNTVKRILKDHGLEPGPKRGAGTWDEFLKRHAVSLWQCDFFAQRIVTMAGIRHAYVLVFLHLKTRHVVVSPATLHPNEAWVIEQADAFVSEARCRQLRVRLVQHDRDSKFARSFADRLRRRHVQTMRTGFCAPNLNAFVERFIQSIRRECLNHFVILGLKHLNHLCKEYADHYRFDRPHQSRDNEPIEKPPDDRIPVEGDIASVRDIRCRSRLGGLLKSYRRKAA